MSRRIRRLVPDEEAPCLQSGPFPFRLSLLLHSQSIPAHPSTEVLFSPFQSSPAPLVTLNLRLVPLLRFFPFPYPSVSSSTTSQDTMHIQCLLFTLSDCLLLCPVLSSHLSMSVCVLKVMYRRREGRRKRGRALHCRQARQAQSVQCGMRNVETPHCCSQSDWRQQRQRGGRRDKTDRQDASDGRR
jgi:hypothetical protein